MKRTVLAIGAALLLIAFSVTLGGAAWSATAAPSPTGHHSVMTATHGSCGCSTTTTTGPPATTTTTSPPPTTTTTTSPPSTTTTTSTPPSTTTTLPVPPPVSGTGTQPPAAAVPTAPTTTSVTLPLTQLPFTGRNLKPFLFAGLLLVGLGLALLAPSEFWRRVARLHSVRLPRGLRKVTRALAPTFLVLRRHGAPSLVGCSFLGF